MKNINTWADVLAANNETQEAFEKRTEHDNETQKANKQVEMICLALNGKWRADYANPDQRKWFPIFVWDVEKACFVFAGSLYDCTYSAAGCGPRLCLETEELSDYAAATFPDIFSTMLKPY